MVCGCVMIFWASLAPWVKYQLRCCGCQKGGVVWHAILEQVLVVLVCSLGCLVSKLQPLLVILWNFVLLLPVFVNTSCHVVPKSCGTVLIHPT